MSQENVELVRQHHAAFIEGNREGAFEPLDPEIEMVFHMLEVSTARGHGEVEEAMRVWLGAWMPGTYRFEPREYRDIGDTVLVRYGEFGLGRGSGAEVAQEAFQVWQVQNGKLIRCEVFRERKEALEAVGLRE